MLLLSANNTWIPSFSKFKKLSIPLEWRYLKIIWLLLWNDLRRALWFLDYGLSSCNVSLQLNPLVNGTESMQLNALRSHDVGWLILVLRSSSFNMFCDSFSFPHNVKNHDVRIIDYYLNTMLLDFVIYYRLKLNCEYSSSQLNP